MHLLRVSRGTIALMMATEWGILGPSAWQCLDDDSFVYTDFGLIDTD